MLLLIVFSISILGPYLLYRDVTKNSNSIKDQDAAITMLAYTYVQFAILSSIITFFWLHPDGEGGEGWILVFGILFGYPILGASGLLVRFIAYRFIPSLNGWKKYILGLGFVIVFYLVLFVWLTISRNVFH